MPTGRDLGRFAGLVDDVLREFQSRDAVGRLWDKDPTLWTTAPERSESIVHRLGWLTVPQSLRPLGEELSRFAQELAEAGIAHVLVMGMGGAVLCSEVLRRTYIPMAGQPELLVLDNAVPATIRRIQSAIQPARTLFVVASRSGTTIETVALSTYFLELARQQEGERAGDHFALITGAGTPLEAEARRSRFRRIFTSPGDIEGRFSALSLFGMVSAAVMGLDVDAFLDRAMVTAEACRPDVPIAENPGARLGATLAALALAGRDKVTLITPAPLEALGLWIQQLVDGRTSGDGKGLVAIAGEPLGRPEVYGKDRVFVQLRTADGADPDADAALDALAAAGHPVIEYVLADTMDLGAEFFRWQVGFALACARLGIDPFDRTDGSGQQDDLELRLAELDRLPEPVALARVDDLVLFGNQEPGRGPEMVGEDVEGRSRVVRTLKKYFARVQPGDYVAITQFFDERERRNELLREIRTRLRDALKVATTAGYGPRCRNSADLYRERRRDRVLNLQLTADDGNDLPVPEKPYGFAAIVRSRYLGEFAAISSRHGRALRVHLGRDVDRSLGVLWTLIDEALGD
jgi:hypothetical protein